MAALPASHRRLAERGAAPTYMVDHPIATDPAAIAALGEVLRDPRAAVGTQLHPWVNPPFDEEVSAINSFPGNLAEALEAAKLDVLTAAIERAFGARPRLYRAGRYGIGPATLRLLAERGYRIDSSMRSRYDYAQEGGPDFSAIGNAAFRTGPGGAIVELPLTTIYTGRARRGGAALHRLLARVPRGRGAFARAGLLSRVALTPEDMPLADVVEAVTVAVGEGVRVLNLSFHSPSLVPGHTPYVRDAADLRLFWRWWEGVLARLDRLGVRAASADELIAAIDAAA